MQAHTNIATKLIVCYKIMLHQYVLIELRAYQILVSTVLPSV